MSQRHLFLIFFDNRLLCLLWLFSPIKQLCLKSSWMQCHSLEFSFPFGYLSFESLLMITFSESLLKWISILCQHKKFPHMLVKVVRYRCLKTRICIIFGRIFRVHLYPIACNLMILNMYSIMVNTTEFYKRISYNFWRYFIFLQNRIKQV